MKRLERLKNVAVIKRGRRIIPNTMIYAHRSGTGRFFECPHQKEKRAAKDKRTGMYRSWHAKEQLACEYSVRAGELNGLFQEWGSDGKLMSEQVYDMGEPQLIRMFGPRTGEMNLEIVSDGCANRQRFWDNKTQKWKEYFVVHDKNVSRKKYVAFLKLRKNVLTKRQQRDQ